MKLLIYVIGGFCLFAAGACLLEDYMGWNRPNTMFLAHVEVHCDRPLAEVIKEQVYEESTPEERAEIDRREARDRDLEEHGV